MDQRIPYTRQQIATEKGVEIAVNIYEGDGPPMLLIHGISSSSKDFENVIPALSEFCQPITLDLRGHGDSSRPGNGYHYDDYVHDLDRVLTALALDRPIVLGHSLGGIVTLLWANEHPNKARAIIIEDSPLRAGTSFGSIFDGWLALNALTEDQARARYAHENPAWSQELVVRRAHDMVSTSRSAIETLRDMGMSGQSLDSTGDLSGITCPLLFLHGDPGTGSLVHPDDLVRLKRQVPQAQIIRIADAGHTIHRSHATQWLEHIRTFVENLPPES